MSATTTVIIPTKSLVKLSGAAREAVAEAANVLSGASAGAGQGRGAYAEASATVATDTGVTNPGGTSMAGGVAWVVSAEDGPNGIQLQLGDPATVVDLPDMIGYTSASEYMADAVSAAASAVRPNLDIDFGTTGYWCTQVAAGAKFSDSLTISDLSPGDVVTVCGVAFTARDGADADPSDCFDPGLTDASTANAFSNKVSNHPALCGKVIVTAWDAYVFVGSLLWVPTLQFSFSLQSTTVGVEYISPDWVFGASGQVDSVLGSPLVLLYESNENQYTADYAFGFSATDINSQLLPDIGLSGSKGLSFAGTATDAAPVVTSNLRNVDPDVATAHDVKIVLTQKAVTSHYIQQAPMSALVSSNGRTTMQKLTRLLRACLSGTDGAGAIDTIQVQTRDAGTPVQDLTWTVGSR